MLLLEARSVARNRAGSRFLGTQCRRRRATRTWKVRAGGEGNPEGDEGDFITNVFEKIFGEREVSPFGLERITVESRPDCFPACLDAYAELLDDDLDEHIKLIRPLLKQTTLEKRPLMLLYDAERDGWTGEAFHKSVDGYGPGVVLCKSEGGCLFGGYNPGGWVGYGDQRDAVSAFLFTDRGGEGSKLPTKIGKIGGASMAIEDEPGFGPMFGVGSLSVKMEPGQEIVAKSRLGSYFSNLPGGGRCLFGDTDNPKGAKLQYLKVFCGTDCGYREPRRS